jgi:ABC-2 type transport system ATP-binding protein
MSLVVSHLHKKYGEKTVLEDLSFSMEKPGVYALLGTNGAGKTTAIRMMLGILAKDGGEVLWNGSPLSYESCNIGYLAEERGLYPKCPLMDQLIYFASLRGVSKNDARERIKYFAERLDVTEYLYPAATKKNKNPSSLKADQLSKGNQQKIQFMISLLSSPELIVLDEPLSGLDPINTDIFKSIIKEQISEGKYLIMSSHQMATVEEFCTDITILAKSKAVLQGNLNEIKKSYGRINLHLKTEADVSEIITASGAVILGEKENEYDIRVGGERDANALLGTLIAREIPVVTFDLREPSLHEIFVEKVGNSTSESL